VLNAYCKRELIWNVAQVERTSDGQIIWTEYAPYPDAES
jgi:hypothetical protein